MGEALFHPPGGKSRLTPSDPPSFTAVVRCVAARPSGIQPPVAKLFFIPVSITAGLLAGVVGKKLFNGLWGVIDQEEPPDSKHRDISWGRLLLAGAIQGAIFRAVKEATDHASRRAFYRTTGTWPGEKRPDPE